MKRRPKNRNAFISLFVVFENHQKQTQTAKGCFDSHSVISTSHSFISTMKRPLSPSASGVNVEDRKMKKKAKAVENEDDNGERVEGLAHFDDNLLFEVLKHVDARTLAMSGCVNKQWHKTAQDERLWELICTKQWANTGCGEQQLRSVVLALGGFRRLHALYLFPLSKPQQTPSSSSSSTSSSSSSAWGPTIPQVIRSKPLRLGKDEVHLSLSLLSIRYYEKMNFNNRTTR
ncbi:hypothetical protein GLYMA_04G042900v4 [Glycine max]|nr:hypothetical protein GYH30_008900 [Glycine max]KRH61354.2 hypothetical protein GLYMA_04G042900v4 [Glycine max]